MADNSFGAEVYAEDWSVKLQEMLDEPTKWKDICKVTYTDTYILHNPYLTDTTAITNNRGCGYEFRAVTMVDDDTTISTFIIIPQFIDRADLAQVTYASQMELAQRQGVILNEALESAVYTAMTSATDFGVLSITGAGAATDTITVSPTNIDDIIRGIKREIREAGGETLLNREGGFIVWRPADLEILEGFMQANGYATADSALKNGATQGIEYMGLTHYSSNLLTANHVAAGVKKQAHVGILKSTYGQVVVNDKDPQNKSGISVVTRLDYAVKLWAISTNVLFDINVA